MERLAKSAIAKFCLSFIRVNRIWSITGIVDDVGAKPWKQDTRVLNSSCEIPVYSRQSALSFNVTSATDSDLSVAGAVVMVLWSRCGPPLLGLTTVFGHHGRSLK